MRTGPTAPGSRLTVAGWQALVLSVMGVLVLAGATTCAGLLHRTDALTRQVTDHLQPARTAA